MALSDDIKSNASATFRTQWTVRDGQVVPAPADLKLSNDAVNFKKATILYADLDQSTALVENKKWEFAAEVYKSFLYAASRLIRYDGGSIVSYDGDRVMGVFVGGRQCNDAVSCALRINYAVRTLVQAEMKKVYTKSEFRIRQVVGIDTSEIRVARTGVRGDNDLVWVGNSANLAAKLTALHADRATYITKRVYNALENGQKFGTQGENIWTKWSWPQHNDDEIYSTTYHRTF